MKPRNGKSLGKNCPGAEHDRYSLLITKHAQKLREEEKASEIEVETSELDILLEDIREKKC